MFKFNKQLTALALLILTSVAGTTLTLSEASARPRRNSRALKEVTLRDRDRRGSFGSNNGVADLSKVGFDNRADFVEINGSVAWRFYTGKNFKGRSTVVKPNTGRSLGRFANKISSFCAVSKCPKK